MVYNFTEIDYEEFVKTIKEEAEPDYKKFHEKLVPNMNNSYGVRLPKLKKMAKEFSKKDFVGFLKFSTANSHEEIMVAGFVIGFIKEDISVRLKYLKEFMPKVNNWAVCDSVVSNFKFKKEEEEQVLTFINECLADGREYYVRVAVVFLMDYFVTEKYVDMVLKTYNSINREEYYINMAIAWGISVCFVKFPDKTMELLKNNSLNNFTYNKALQKIVESSRVSKETKEIIKLMKRK
ncbi:MAG: DNA alkylation repair protein [Anaerotignaceae bacterium]